MLRIHTEITINASIEEVWSVLMDTDKYGEWNPFIIKFNKRPDSLNLLKNDNNMQFECTHPVKGNMKFDVNLLKCSKEEKKLIWIGIILFKGFFSGKHFFELYEKKGTTLLVHREEFYGVITHILKKTAGLETNTTKNYLSMNDALKKRVENRTKKD